MRKTTPYGIRTIAEQLGISSSTVSRALNNNPRISRETRTKVLRLARELGRPTGKDHQKTILLILPALRFSLKGYSYEIINAVRRECLNRGFFLEMIAGDQLGTLNDRDYSGAISFDFSLRIARFWGDCYTIPLVALNDYPNHLENISTVFSDARSAFTLAVRHLFRNGHRRIGMLQFENSNHDNLSAAHRREAFVQSMDAYGLGEGAFCVNMGSNDPAFPEFYEILKNRITALIVCGEGVAVYRTIGFLKASGIRIPEDLSLITWETGEISELLTPPMTTVAQNFPELVSRAFSVLEDVMAGKSTAKDIAVPYLFHDRKSVGTPCKTDAGMVW